MGESDAYLSNPRAHVHGQLRKGHSAPVHCCPSSFFPAFGTAPTSHPVFRP